jgi:hypothetical protein
MSAAECAASSAAGGRTGFDIKSTLTPTMVRHPYTGRTTTMHPTIEYEITKAQIADQHRRGGRIASAQAASRAARGLTSQGRHPAARLARRVFAVLAARRLPAPARSRQLAACQSPACCSTCA